ncbi:MAG: flotillin-like FloA family protein, partial [Planctomycetales bacterium]|nr:flotillin-like FloA family protein [Planctomycetales bacterium]
MFSPLFAQDPATIAIIAVFFVAVFFLVIFLAVFARFARLWVQAKTTNAEIGMFDLIGMWFRKVNPTVIVRSKIMAV